MRPFFCAPPLGFSPSSGGTLPQGQTQPDATFMFSKRLEIIRIEGHDPRCDDGRRIVELSRDGVIVKRIVSGVLMSIRVALSDFHGVTTRFVPGKNASPYELWLTHRDPDLTLLLAVSDDRRAIEIERLEWTNFLCLPARGESSGDDESEAAHEPAPPHPSSPQPRARGFVTAARRPRFLARRKVGGSKRPQPIHPRPRILFDGSRPER